CAGGSQTLQAGKVLAVVGDTANARGYVFSQQPVHIVVDMRLVGAGCQDDLDILIRDPSGIQLLQQYRGVVLRPGHPGLSRDQDRRRTPAARDLAEPGRPDRLLQTPSYNVLRGGGRGFDTGFQIGDLDPAWNGKGDLSGSIRYALSFHIRIGWDV